MPPRPFISRPAPKPVLKLNSRFTTQAQPGDPVDYFRYSDVNISMVKRSLTVTKNVEVGQVVKRSEGSKIGHRLVKNEESQTWLYEGGIVPRADSTEINGTYYSDHKDLPSTLQNSGKTEKQECEDNGTPYANVAQKVGKPRRKHESNFFITINPNKAFVGQRTEATAAIVAALKHLSEPRTLRDLLTFGPKHDHYERDKFEDVIDPKGIDFTSTVEVGPKLGRLHAHIILGFVHFSQIQINKPATQIAFVWAFNNEMAKLGGTTKLTSRPYCQVKLLPQSGSADIMKRYIRKAMLGSNVDSLI